MIFCQNRTNYGKASLGLRRLRDRPKVLKSVLREPQGCTCIQAPLDFPFRVLRHCSQIRTSCHYCSQVSLPLSTVEQINPEPWCRHFELGGPPHTYLQHCFHESIEVLRTVGFLCTIEMMNKTGEGSPLVVLLQRTVHRTAYMLLYHYGNQ